MDDKEWMRRAIDIAGGNPAAPFGAVLVDRETMETVATGINQARNNPSLHGEMDALNQYASKGMGHWHRLVLFTTAEPCCMCQAAILWAGIPRVVYGVSIQDLVRLGWRQFDLSAEDVVNAARFGNCELHGGVLRDECLALFPNKSSRQ